LLKAKYAEEADLAENDSIIEISTDQNPIPTDLSIGKNSFISTDQDPIPTDPLAFLLSLTIKDNNDFTLTINDIFHQDIMVISLLRHFGCLLCKKAANVLSVLKPKLFDL
jgi:hypothetical protein